MSESDGLIVGDGPVALTLALALRRQRRQVRLLMRSNISGAASGGRYYALSRRRLAFLRELGVSPPAIKVRRFLLYAGGVRLPLFGAPMCHIVREEELWSALKARVRDEAVAITTGDDIGDINTTKNSISLSAGGKRHVAALLAVADGARSPLAAQLGIFGAVFNFKQQAVVARVKAESLSADTAYQWFGDNDTVALLPTGDGEFSLIWSTATPPPSSSAALAGELSRRTKVEGIEVMGDVSPRAFPLRGVRRAVRVAPRCALLGDAARVIHPLAGQGLNLGLADVECLVTCLRRRSDLGTAAALSAYAAVRDDHAAILHQVTSVLARSQRAAALALAAGRLPGMGALAGMVAGG